MRAGRVTVLEEGEDVSLTDLVSKVLLTDASRRGGALVIYVGVVKGRVGSHRVSKLHYYMHEGYTKEKLERAVSEVLRDGDVIDARILLWKGSRVPGAPAVVITVLAVGRKKAFETAYKLLEKVKFETGIWKKEFRDDGVFWVVGGGERIRSGASEG